MEEEITFGAKLLNGFLSVTVVTLVGVLLGVVACLILAAFGAF